MNFTLILMSAFAFMFYGIMCLMTNHMSEEFHRYGMANYRKLVGVLELLGGIGLLVGLVFHPLLLFSSAGLAVLMLMGTFVRIRTKDPWLQIIPAFSLMLINIYIFTDCLFF